MTALRTTCQYACSIVDNSTQTLYITSTAPILSLNSNIEHEIINPLAHIFT